MTCGGRTLFQLPGIPARGILDQFATFHEPLRQTDDAEAKDAVTNDLALACRRWWGHRRPFVCAAFVRRHPSRHIFEGLGCANRTLQRVVDFFTVDTESSDTQL